MSHQRFKRRIYPLFARIAHALGNDRRLEILELLAQAPRHVDAIAAETDMPVASVSQHLQVLRQAQLVQVERRGRRSQYGLAGDDVLPLCLSLRSVAEHHLAELGRVTSTLEAQRKSIAALSRAEAQALTEQGGIIVLADVRPRSEYEHGHLPGAVSLPLDELPVALTNVSKRAAIVAYGRSAYCLFPDDAVTLLRKEGFEAVRLEGGWAEWKAEGRATAAESSAPR